MEDNNPSEKVIPQKEEAQNKINIKNENKNVNEEINDTDTNTNININQIKNEKLRPAEEKKSEKNNKINEETHNIKKNSTKKEKDDKAKFLSEVKYYLNLNVKDIDYTDRINNKSETLFETLKEATIMKWETKFIIKPHQII